MSAQQIAEEILGPVRWENPTQGFCRCPGEALHTKPTGPKHCLIHIDGAPTIHCFHSSCAAAVAQVNQKLRQALRSPQFAGPGPRAPLIYNPRGNEQPARDALSDWYAAALPTALADLAWPAPEIERNSPVPGVSKLAPRAQFHAWSQLWPRGSIIWTGDVMSSGAPGHANNFRPVERWRQLGPAGNFTCPSTFKPGSFSRSEENVTERLFLVVESDTLSRDQVGAVFLFIRTRLRYRLNCVIDTGGKSLHAWFNAPPPEHMPFLKKALTAMQCDPKMFGPSQPCRVPGAMRGDRLQSLLWLDA